MLGKETEHNYHLGGHCDGEPLLEVKHLNSGNTLHDINLCVRCEVVALPDSSAPTHGNGKGYSWYRYI